jgi:heme A synthase
LRFAGAHIDEHRSAALAVMVLVAAQIGLGVLNVVLLTPIWIQILHLLVADLLWISVILLGLELSAKSPGPTPGRS